jgi:DUF2934 family protein
MSPATGTKAAPIPETSKEIPQNESTTEQIRQRAYDIYVSRAGAPGDEVQDWLQAERERSSK